MTQTLAPKLTAVEKRTAFMVEMAKPINDHYETARLMHQLGQEYPGHPAHEVFVDIAKRIAKEGKALGRTDRWQAACGFAQTEINANPNDAEHARWAVIQQSVYLAHAID